MENERQLTYAEIGAILTAVSVSLDRAERLLIKLIVKDLELPPEAKNHYIDIFRAQRESSIGKQNQDV